jgi:hypothetical protein
VLQFAPSPLAMATAPATTTSTAGGFFYVWNTGTQPANGLTWTVGGTDAADFVLPAAAFNVPQLQSIGLNDTHQFTTQFTPPGAATYTATASLSSSGGLANVCQTALPTLTITGSGE